MLDAKRVIYLILYYASRIYFAFVNLVFSVINWFFRGSKGPLSRVDDPLLLKSAVQLSTEIRGSRITSEAVVKSYIKRCEYANKHCNCIVRNRYELALDEARAVDKSVRDGTAPPPDKAPFLGVPFTLKDCIFVKGLICTAGIIKRAAGEPETKDAETVRLLTQAGGIVLAVTNVSEVCMWWESNNGIYGRTNNPYDHRCIVGGSSGGEGCLIGAGGSVIGIGSDIGGSIRMPAFFNGIFGHKATKHLIDDAGCYPDVIGYQRDMHQPGPMCRYAGDLMPMLKVLAGPKNSWKIVDEKVNFNKLKVYYMEDISHPEVGALHLELKRCLRKVVAHLESTFEIQAVRVDLPLVHQIVQIWLNDMNEPNAPKFAQEMANREGEVNPYLHTCMHLVKRSSHTAAALALALYEDMFSKFVAAERQTFLTARREKLERQFASLLAEPASSGMNAIFLMPPHSTTAPFHKQPLLQPFNFAYTALFNSLCLPVTQVPLGLDSHGLPLGVQVVAALNHDHVTLQVAEELERKFGGWTNFPE